MQSVDGSNDMAGPAMFGSCQRASPLYTAYALGFRPHAYPLCQTKLADCHCKERPPPPVIARSAATWQSRRRSNGGLPTCVQPQRDCHAALAMTVGWALLGMTVGQFGLTKWVCVTDSDCLATGYRLNWHVSGVSHYGTRLQPSMFTWLMT